MSDTARHPALVGKRLQASPPARRAPRPRRRTAGAISARSSCGVIALGVDQHVGPLAQRRQQRQLPLDPDRRRLVRAERMPPAGLAVAPRQRDRRRSRDRPAPAPAPRPPRPRPARPACRSTEKSRLRGSIPITTGRSAAPPANSRGRKLIGRLSIASKPRSSSASIAVDRPAPGGPLMMTMCCPAQGVLPQSPCTPCPTNRPCLPQSGKARPFCTKTVNAASRFGTSLPEINSTSTSETRDCHRLWHSCRGSAVEVDRQRPRPPPAHRRHAAAARGPAPRSARRAPPARCATSAAPGARSRTRSSATSAAPRADQRQRQRRLAGARRAENQHAAAGEGHRRAMQNRRLLVSAASSAPPFPLAHANANATEHRSQQFPTHQSRAFVRRGSD